ncbi:MAG: hypothetical protein U0452_15570 [Anaerolineae bacterium]
MTAAPYALSVALVVLLLAKYPLRRRVGLLATSRTVVAIAFAGPLLLLMIRRRNLRHCRWDGSARVLVGDCPALRENLALLGILTDFGNRLSSWR